MAKRKQGITTNSKSADSPADIPDSSVDVSWRPKSWQKMSVNERQSWAEKELIANVMLSRAELFRRILDPRRDIDAECGYKSISEIAPEDYRLMYDSEAIAARVVEILPKECWKATPMVYEEEDPEKVTPFEVSWDQLGKGLRGESWCKQEKGSPVWAYLKRADILSGIGHYGVILLGIDDGRDLSEPVAGVSETGELAGTKRNGRPIVRDVAGEIPITSNLSQGNPPTAQKPATKRKLLYMRVFDESLAKVAEYETGDNNPRNGLPKYYNITLNDPSNQQEGMGLSTATKKVHWHRVIHVADNLGSSETMGVPRMQQVWRNLSNLVKLYGGSAEMYWRGAFPGLSIETQPQLGGGGTTERLSIDAKATRAEIANYQNGLQRALLLMGLTAKSLAPQVVDPTPQIDAQITAICIVKAVPKRIFMGSERGELSSAQDEKDWADDLTGRRETYLTPHLIRLFADRGIMLGYLAEPGEDGYKVEWPDVESMTSLEQAQVAVTKTEALAKYVSGNVMLVMPPVDWYTRVFGMTEEEAIEVNDNAEEYIITSNPDADEDSIVAGKNPPLPIEDILPSFGQPPSRGGNGAKPPPRRSANPRQTTAGVIR
jgi:hypothetical protein